MKKELTTLLSEVSGVDPEDITEDKTMADLDLDSLDLLEFTIEVEDKYGLAELKIPLTATLGDLLAQLEQLVKK